MKGDASKCGSMSHQILRGTLPEVVGKTATAAGIRGSQACGQKWAPPWASLAVGLSLPLPPGALFLRAGRSAHLHSSWAPWPRFPALFLCRLPACQRPCQDPRSSSGSDEPRPPGFTLIFPLLKFIVYIELIREICVMWVAGK